MTKISQIHEPKSFEPTRRPFAKIGVATVALFAGLQIAAPATTFLTPKTASAEETVGKKTVWGQNLDVITPSYGKTIAQLRQEVPADQKGEHVPDTTDPAHLDWLDISFSDHMISFILVVPPDNKNIEMGVHFPKRLDSPTAKTPGVKGLAIDDLADLVFRNTGKRMAKAEIVREQVASSGGSPYVNAYALPLDSAGNKITQISSNQYIVYVMQYFESDGKAHCAGGINILQDSGIGPLARR